MSELLFAKNMIDASLVENVHYNRDLEGYLLGCILHDNNDIDKISFIKAENFHFDYNRDIFNLMNLLRANYKAINVVSISADLVKVINVTDEDVGIKEYCEHLLEMTNSTMDILQIATLVKECWQRRAFHKVLCHGLTMSTKNNKKLTTESILAYAEKLNMIIEQNQEMKAFNNILLTSLDDIQTGVVAQARVQTGYAQLDSRHRIVNRGRLTVIGASTGGGKSAFALNLLYKISSHTPTLFLSMEMREEEITQRLWSVVAGVELHKILEHSPDKPKLCGSDFEKMFACDLFENQNLELIYQTSTVTDFISLFKKINYNRVKNNLEKIGVVFIDYIGLFDLTDISAKDSYTQYGEIMNKLYNFAKSENIAIIVLAQLKRDAQLLKEEERPNLNHIAVSFKIAQDADTVILLSGKKEQMFATIAKNRAGETGEVEMFFNRSTQQITECYVEQKVHDFSYDKVGDK